MTLTIVLLRKTALVISLLSVYSIYDLDLIVVVQLPTYKKHVLTQCSKSYQLMCIVSSAVDILTQIKSFCYVHGTKNVEGQGHMAI